LHSKLYHYKRPGDWFWRQIDTESIAATARTYGLGNDWRYRVEGDSTNRTLAELVEMERLDKEHSDHAPVEPSFTAPDGRWGYITVVLCCAALTLILLVPSQQPHSSGKFYLSGAVLIWMSHGIRQISAARAWKRRHLPRRKA
jgi:hypothetical protein